MADTQLITQQGAMAKAAVIRTSLANSKLRLVKGTLNITQNTTKEQLVASEADFDGYPAGGYTLATWLAPTLVSEGGAALTSPLTNVTYGPAADPPVGNTLCGWWVEDSTGNVRLVGQWAPGRPVQADGDGFPVIVQMIEGRNAMIQLQQ